MGYKHLWNSRKKNIPVQNAAALFQFMTGNAVSVKKRWMIKFQLTEVEFDGGNMSKKESDGKVYRAGVGRTNKK